MEVKNISDLNLDEITEEFMLNECLQMGTELGIDIQQGSIYRDASDGHIIRTAKFFNDLRQVSKILSIYTCTGEVLNERLRERGMERNPPADTSAKYYVEFVGADPQIGDRVSCDGHYFVIENADERFVITSEETGTQMNNLIFGLPVIPERDVDNLISATLQELATPAVDMEDDDSARTRFINMISGPSENGNKAQLRSWCEGIQGVGRAKIVPLWAGEGTALGIIISTNATVPRQEVVNLVQETIDPGAEGMGEGLATIGCHFSAIAAEKVTIDISVDVTKQAGSTYSGIKDDIVTIITNYLKDLVLHSYLEEVIVRYNSIGALISQISNIVDYDNLVVSGGTENILCSIYQVPVVGEVEVNGNL